jgi:hypothetical protein
MRRYWINTHDTTKRVGFNLTSMEPILSIVLTFDLVECSWFEYLMFMKFKINLKAEKKNRFAWFTWEREIKKWQKYFTKTTKDF